MSISKNILAVKNTIPQDVTLVAVSKTKPTNEILEAYHAGQRVFGENKIQEMAAKWKEMPKDIEWHMIGHVQRNKVKYMAPFVSLIHAVDSVRLLTEINKQALKSNRVIDCLLQIKIADEESKFGMSEADVQALLDSEEIKTLQNVKAIGLMGMATFTNDDNQLKEEFGYLKSIYLKLKTQHTDLHILSMGMSSDCTLAIKNGSTMVRVGSAIFGARNYN
ncbi:MAG: YggS family pyridoxal phosphate-dependent enzyme [Flavobacteriaceae bacterium]|nr:YggS family pyridoxal phosphate-dependent enzyme [Flavobacteriaceae bacterium]